MKVLKLNINTKPSSMLNLYYFNYYTRKFSDCCYLFRLSSLPKYYIPRDGSLQSYKDYIVTLPAIDQPQAFGQHPNADITSLITETRVLCETLMSLQVQGSGPQETNKEDDVCDPQSLLTLNILGSTKVLYCH